VDICFATNNKHKLDEVAQMLPPNIKLLTLVEIGCKEDIPETKDTIEDNSAQKAQYIFDKYNISCFADDTGLEVEALNNEPGVFSARYAGEHGNAEANMNKLLKNLEGKNNRKARFKTCITYIDKNGAMFQFLGIVNGIIISEKRGNNGFGYDPIFVPENFNNTFAELDSSVKNKISHRALATKKLVEFFNS
jgi:XTP/dITP diphosphohydrolase